MLLPGDKLDQQTADVGLTGRDAVLYHTATAVAGTQTLTLTERTRSLIIGTVGGACAVTLPGVAQFAGMTLFMYMIADDGNNVTINDAGDDIDFDTVTLDTVNDRAVLMSDGIHWFCMDGGATAPA